MPQWTYKPQDDAHICHLGTVRVTVYRFPGAIAYRLETSPPVVDRRALEESLVKSQEKAVELVRQFAQAILQSAEA